MSHAFWCPELGKIKPPRTSYKVINPHQFSPGTTVSIFHLEHHTQFLPVVAESLHEICCHRIVINIFFWSKQTRKKKNRKKDVYIPQQNLTHLMDKGPWWHSRQTSQWGSIWNSERFKLWTLQTLRREVRLLNSWQSALSCRWELVKTKDSSSTVTAFISLSDITSLASFAVASSFTLKKS